MFFASLQEQRAEEAAAAEHRRLKKVTDQVICNHNELLDFSLCLGIPRNLIERMINNHPNNIAVASFLLVSNWWDSAHFTSSYEEKVALMTDAAVEMRKDDLVPYIRKTMSLEASE